MFGPYPAGTAASCAVVLLALGATVPRTACAQNLLDFSIEQLLDMEITSASRKEQPVSQAAAAVFVITQDDIRRSGARNIPEALRMAPGLQVAQIDGNKWAISARGFMGRFANKLLVLMDGRTLYTPSFSGVFWDVQDTLMENIERIEIIRGPGGTLWGTNAVNGIINIITRKAKDVAGRLATASYRDEGSFSGALRFGNSADALDYSVFVKVSDIEGNRTLDGRDSPDTWRQSRAGARLDWDLRDHGRLSVTSEVHAGKSGESLQLSQLSPPYAMRLDGQQDIDGSFVMGRWDHESSEGRQNSVQLLVDSTSRSTPIFGEERSSVALEAQRRWRVGKRHDLVSGVGYRINRFDIRQTPQIGLTDHSSNDSQLNAFVQDEISLRGDQLLLIIGTKLENNSLSDDDIEVMPNIRANWKVGESHNIWGAITSAVRTPSHADRSAVITGLGVSSVIPPLNAQNPLPIPIQIQLVGNPSFNSEDLAAFEVGYRGELNRTLTIDATVFLHEYTHLRGATSAGLFCDSTGEPFLPSAPPPACLFTSTSLFNRFTFDNSLELESYGTEIALDWRIHERARLAVAYTALRILQESEVNALDVSVAGNNPDHQLSIRTDVKLARNVNFDVWLRHVGTIDNSGIDAYWNTDVRVAWQPREGLEMALSVRNLFDDGRLEFLSELQDLMPIEIERSIAASVRWAF